MNSFAKSFSLSACALAAAVLISACGGGTAGDIVPPTVTATSAASTTAGAAAGTKTFTFVFSEDIGKSFSVEDLVVTDGAPSNFAKVNATTYTVDVTPSLPTSNPSVTLPAGKVFDLANNPNSAAFTLLTAPNAAAATPTALQADVISIYSDAYTPMTGLDLRPDWGQPTQVTEVLVANNKTEKYTAFSYEGIQFASTDVSAMSKLHIDVWTPDVTSFKVFIISPGKENAVTLTPTLAGWNSFDIDLAQYTVPDKTAIFQIKLEGAPAGGTLYFDNLYFWKAATAPGGGGSGSGGTVGVTFDEATPPTVVGFNGGESSGIAAGPTGGSANALKIVRIGGDPWAGAKVTGLTISLSAANPTITARVNSPAAGIPFVLKLEGGGTASVETQASTSVVAGWQTLSWTFSGADLKDWTDLVFLPNLTHVAPAAPGETYYVDDITGVSIPAATPTVAMGAGGAQTLTITTGDVKTGDAGNTMFVAGEGIFAVNYVGSAETAAPHNLAAWPGAKSANFTGITGVAGGDIGYFQDDVNLSISGVQYVDQGGWVSGTSLVPTGVPNFFRYYVLKGAVSSSAYMGLYVNAPNNGTVNVSSFSKIKLKVWGPGPMFEQTNFTPTLEVILTGPKVAGCTATGSGGTEITQNLTANLRNGAGGFFTLPFSGFTVKGLCGTTDTNSNAVANVLANLARVVVTVPGTSFNYINAVGGNFSTGVNLGPVGFTNI